MWVGAYTMTNMLFQKRLNKNLLNGDFKEKIMKELLGREVKIGGKEGEITNILGVGYEISFFNINDGKTYIDAREIEKYLV